MKYSKLADIMDYVPFSFSLQTISEPVKTLCGHRFCRQCIQTLLQSKNALCPLCNRAIQRRSISKDEHMILYIDGLQKLIEAVQSDSGIDSKYFRLIEEITTIFRRRISDVRKLHSSINKIIIIVVEIKNV